MNASPSLLSRLAYATSDLASLESEERIARSLAGASFNLDTYGATRDAQSRTNAARLRLAAVKRDQLAAAEAWLEDARREEDLAIARVAAEPIHPDDVDALRVAFSDVRTTRAIVEHLRAEAIREGR